MIKIRKEKQLAMIIAAIISLILIPSFAASPQLPSEGSGNNDGVVVVFRRPNKPGDPIPTRPKSPSKQNISCRYLDGSLILSFSYPEGICELRVYDREINHLRKYTFDSAEEEIIIQVGFIHDASLQILTNDGNIYEGELSL